MIYNNYIYYIGIFVDLMVREWVFVNFNELNVIMIDVCIVLNIENNMYSLIKNGMVWFLMIMWKYIFSMNMIIIVLYVLCFCYVSKIM